MTDYQSICVNETRGRAIAALYMSAPVEITPEARCAYGAFAQQVREQFEDIRRTVRVIFQDDDPYADAPAMFDDVFHRATLRVYRTQEGEDTPCLTHAENDQFRAVHDYLGHYGGRVTFTRHGEEAAWVRHSQMFTPLARRAMTTETRGQNSAFIFALNGRQFPEQKAILLPAWVSSIPSEYR